MIIDWCCVLTMFLSIPTDKFDLHVIDCTRC